LASVVLRSQINHARMTSIIDHKKLFEWTRATGNIQSYWSKDD